MIMVLVLFAFRTCLRSVIKPEPKCRTLKKKVSNESHVKSYEFSSFEAGLNGPTLPNSGSDLRTLVRYSVLGDVVKPWLVSNCAVSRAVGNFGRGKNWAALKKQSTMVRMVILPKKVKQYGTTVCQEWELVLVVWWEVTRASSHYNCLKKVYLKVS